MLGSLSNFPTSITVGYCYKLAKTCYLHLGEKYNLLTGNLMRNLNKLIQSEQLL